MVKKYILLCGKFFFVLIVEGVVGVMWELGNILDFMLEIIVDKIEYIELMLGDDMIDLVLYNIIVVLFSGIFE